MDDDVTFNIVSVSSIRKGDVYGGLCVGIRAIYDTITTPLTIDISTGDIITPSPVQYKFAGIFDDSVRLKLWGYNIETVMAEKIETMLSRGIFSTRPRDYYDVYILSTTQVYDKALFIKALMETSKHRGSEQKLDDIEAIINLLAENHGLQQMWEKYQKKFTYAVGISYNSIIEVLQKLVFF